MNKRTKCAKCAKCAKYQLRRICAMMLALVSLLMGTFSVMGQSPSATMTSQEAKAVYDAYFAVARP